ncbi:MAG: hypothetical protein Q7S51_02635 [Gallionellaceae bacterium]|nr:hypothetical protein [Gallionellaceae bacterium]
MKGLAIQAFIRRLMNRAPFRCAMASMGGVGSTALARHIGSIVDKTEREHAFSPVLFSAETNLRIGYLYGNPYNAVASVFRRNYQDMHVRAMNAGSGTHPAMLSGVSLEAYLERGADEFNMERQFDNWVNHAPSHAPVILIKYETLAEHIPEVLKFFACRYPFEVKQRRTTWRDQPEPVRKGLERIYGGLLAKVEAMPPIKILYPVGMENLNEYA